MAAAQFSFRTSVFPKNTVFDGWNTRAEKKKNSLSDRKKSLPLQNVMPKSPFKMYREKL